MGQEVKVTTERVDDIPLLLEQLLRMGVQTIFDRVFPRHKNWHGLTPGFVLVIWLAYIVSQADHRLNRVENWVENHLEMLRLSIKQNVTPLDFSDDKLANILRYISDDESWALFEKELNGHTLRVYNLEKEPIRLDSTTISGYWKITEDGLFQLGHSKDHRPDLPQIKVNLTTLDPLGMPLVTHILSGNTADDPLYIPAIKSVRESIPGKGLFYIGDCKMSAQPIRAFINKGEDYYLCPLSALQFSAEQLDKTLEHLGQENIVDVYRSDNSDGKKLIAKGFEKNHTMTSIVDEQEHTWQERRLFIRSLKLAEAEEKAFDARINKAQEELQSINDRKRGKRLFTKIEEVQSKVESIFKHYRVIEFFDCQIQEISRQRVKRRYQDRPAQIIEEKEFKVTATLSESVVAKSRQRLGWRVYATNHNQETLSLEKAVLAYRNEYIIERGFSRLKGSPLSISPTYLQKEDHAEGLIRLLSW